MVRPRKKSRESDYKKVSNLNKCCVFRYFISKKKLAISKWRPGKRERAGRVQYKIAALRPELRRISVPSHLSTPSPWAASSVPPPASHSPLYLIQIIDERRCTRELER